MKFLLDTHILLWWLEDNQQKLSSQNRDLISDPLNQILVSVATIWEISIKTSLGRLDLEENLLEAMQKESLEILSITPEQAWNAGILIVHHEDPFDRILITQAIDQNCTLVTVDKTLKKYEAEGLKIK